VTFKSFYNMFLADLYGFTKLVSVRWSAIATALSGAILLNEHILMELLDRVATPAMRDTLVGGVMFMVFLVPSLRAEYAPVPTTDPAKELSDATKQ
jgi:hypothetical protein